MMGSTGLIEFGLHRRAWKKVQVDETEVFSTSNPVY